ncbi:ecotropic viral integration site 5 [Brevipalpus obovatus]|uniref:ecotropic viral integration site 5 n=1 Tax=Brevipalpus obovatus TaxID=246614 RepID=UPI003D9DE338
MSTTNFPPSTLSTTSPTPPPPPQNLDQQQSPTTLSKSISSSSDTPNSTNNNNSLLNCNSVSVNGVDRDSIANECSEEDLELLARLEAQNRLIETDIKSLNSLANSGHSRQSSDTSTMSESHGDLWIVWGQLINDWTDQYRKRTTFVKELVRKGIPQHFRGLAWQYLCNARSNVPREKYAEYLQQSSPCEKIIKRDIARTYPAHDFFKDKDGPGQVGLFNVMKAYSIHDKEVGYCQGSAFLVGVLLLQMPEEDAFAVLVRLMEDYRLREIYKPTMAELGLCIYQLECSVQELLPELNRHFQSQNFYTSMYASSWFLTLFTSCLPLHIANRVMDLFLSEGMEVIFRLSLAILMISKEELLKLDMEGLLKYFQKDIFSKLEVDPDYLITLAIHVKYDQKKMKKLTKEYNALKTKEQEEMVELRKLRTENRLLRQRIESLEVESAELADKLIKGQISRAEEAEDNFQIKRELSGLKQREQELQKEIDKANLTIKELKDVRAFNNSLESQEAHQVIDSLQEELVAVKLREAENNDEMKSLRARIGELEEVNKQLREVPPDHAVAQLQEELIAVKLREAEANLSMKELRQKFNDLNQMWTEHLSTSHANSDSSQPSSLEQANAPTPSALSVTSSPLKMLNNLKRSSEFSNEIIKLKQELMTAKLREAEAVAELKELRQRVMELETQNQVSLNQIRRQAEEINKIRREQDSISDQRVNFSKELQQERQKYIELDSKFKEQQFMNRIKDMEQTQIIAELRQKVSALEVTKEELVTVQKLEESGNEPQDSEELHDRMVELQSEIFRLEVSNYKLNNMQNLTNGSTGPCNNSYKTSATGSQTHDVTIT